MTDAVAVERRGTQVTLAAADLRAIGLPAPGAGRCALDAIAGLRWAIDDTRQTLTLSYALAPRQQLAVPADTATADVPLTPSGWGAIIGYEAVATRGAGIGEAVALFDAALYTPRGYGYATVLASARDHAGVRATRLQTGFTMIDRDRMRRLVLGDTISGGTVFSRPVRMAGVQYSTDFSVRPDLVTFPLPEIAGAAAVPSAVDVIVNGNRRPAGNVRAGSFAVRDVPVQTGVNRISVTTRDALGREVVRSIASYTSSALLRPGLSAFSLETGLVRLGYGTDRDRYGSPAFSMSVRHGVSNRLTLEAHAEGDTGQVAGGAGIALGLGALGQVDGAMMLSRGPDGSGAQFTAGVERIGGGFSVAGRYTRATRGWADLAARYGATTRSRTLLLNIGFDLRALGTASVGLIDLGRGWMTRGVATGAPITGVDEGLARISRYSLNPGRFVTANHSVRLGRGVSLLTNSGVDLRRRGSFYASIGLFATLGGRTNGYVAAQVRPDGAGAVAEIASNAMLPGEVGYRIGVAKGTIDRMAAGVEYQGSRGRIGIAAEQVAGRSAVRATVRGSLIVAGGGVYAADTNANSIAIVDTSGQGGVKVYRDNRFAGTTDRNGRLVVTNLSPFLPTKISIDPEQMSDEFDVATRDIVVRPSERTGVPVSFRLSRDRSALMTLIGADGQPVPAGSRVTINGGPAIPVGIMGQVFVPVLPASGHLVLRLDSGQYCRSAVMGGRQIGSTLTFGNVYCTVPLTAAR